MAPGADSQKSCEPLPRSSKFQKIFEIQESVGRLRVRYNNPI